MATGAVKGRLATLKLQKVSGGGSLGSFIVGRVRNWNVVHTEEMIDASSADSSGWNEHIPGQRGWRFTAEAVYDITTVGSPTQTAVRKELLNDILSRPSNYEGMAAPWYEFRLKPDGANSNWVYTNPQFLSTSGQTRATFRVTNFRVGGRYDDVVLFDFEITGSGKLNYSS